MAGDREVEHVIKNENGRIAEKNSHLCSGDPRDIPG
jgi:hypothetical protein